MFQEETLKFVKLSPLAFAPSKGSTSSCGYDLHSPYNCIAPAKGQVLINLELAFELPDHCYARLAPRSGLALYNGINVHAGVIDRDYCGAYKILLFNNSDADFHIKRGMKIGQLICERCAYPRLIECRSINDFSGHSTSKRQTSGFGSSGM
jgi:dUTP pyrophosphatase